ncbi:hypothetical protein NDU88_005376 [Pleurodeles waltl]|uniref:Uncharacterized protein n=1 Tax=Pleurodeles waltl TaxID=8319 RepID=A0AAV7TX30_PLEWA|nr:hypothetical protein NDU88_005376 [Pleurodeles waltl]
MVAFQQAPDWTDVFVRILILPVVLTFCLLQSYFCSRTFRQKWRSVEEELTRKRMGEVEVDEGLIEKVSEKRVSAQNKYKGGPRRTVCVKERVSCAHSNSSSSPRGTKKRTRDGSKEDCFRGTENRKEEEENNGDESGEEADAGDKAGRRGSDEEDVEGDSTYQEEVDAERWKAVRTREKDPGAEETTPE